MSLRNRIDRAFEIWARGVYVHRYATLILSLIAVAALASLLPGIRSENSAESYLHGDDPASVKYEEFQRQFGQDDRVLIAVESDAIFGLPFLEKLRSFHSELEESLPHLHEVTSLLNARQTRGEGDLLIVEDLLEEWPRSDEDLVRLRERVFTNPLYLDNLISRDGLLTTLTIELVTYTEAGGDDDVLAGFDQPGEEARGEEIESPLLSEEEKAELIEALWPLVDRYQASDFRLYVVGGVVISREVTTRMTEDVGVHVSTTAVAIAIFLLLLFRRASGVIYPMLVVAAAMTANIGAMVWLDIPFSIILGMLPIFTMCIGVCNVVHVLVLVYQRLAEGANREDALVYAFGHAGLSIVMASLTTAAGMLSFLSAELAPIRHLGVTAPIGVLFAFVFTMTLLPALIGIIPLRARARWAPTGGGGWTQSFLVWVGNGAVRNYKRILLVGLLCFALTGIGLAHVRFAHKPLDWFPADNPIRIAVERIDRDLRGGTTAEVVIDTGRENGMQEPAVLKRIEASMREVESVEHGALFVGKAMSLVDILEETHQALNGNDPVFRRVPDDPALAAQELLLFENSGSDDIETFTDSQFRLGRVTLRVPIADAMLYGPFLDKVESVFSRHLGAEADFHVTGRSTLRGRTFSALVNSMVKSYAVALVVITPLMMMMIGNVRLGLISMVPNLLPVLLTLSAMGLMDVPLDASSIMIGSIIIGLAVDDTIHFLRRVQRELEICGELRGAVEETMRTTGSALFFTSLVLATGFGVMGSMGSMKNTVYFGYFTSLGIAVAFIANVTLTPALLRFAARLLSSAGSAAAPRDARSTGLATGE